MTKQRYNFNKAMSACLLGVPCRWNAKSKKNKKALAIFSEGKTLIICPEIIAGLGIPREACEIKGGDGKAVLSGKAKVVDKHGTDFTKKFLKGAKMSLDIVKKNNIKTVYLKSGSPSCGAGTIYSGKFDGKKVTGNGLFTALLHKHKIRTVELG